MLIDTTTYSLSDFNYVPVEFVKSQIILGSTHNNDMKHIIGWSHRYNGKYKKTAPFTIDKNGLVYQHFNPKFHSKFFRNKQLNLKSIVILLENDGWLLKDDKKNEFITWSGNIYSQPTDIFDKRWRNYNYWAPYSQEQFESALKLVTKLCYDFNIPLNAISHNTKIDNLADFNGVLYRSNLEKYYTDLNPSWDFELFKQKIEKNGEN